MDDLDRRLREQLQRGEPRNPELEEALEESFARRLRRIRWLTHAVLAVSVGMILGGARGLMHGEETRALVSYGVLVVLGGQVQLLVKLWYWQVNTRIQLQRDLRLLRV